MCGKTQHKQGEKKNSLTFVIAELKLIGEKIDLTFQRKRLPLPIAWSWKLWKTLQDPNIYDLHTNTKGIQTYKIT